MKKAEIEREKIERFYKGEFSKEDEEYVNGVFCDNNKEKELEIFLRKHWYEDFFEDGNSQKRNLDHILYKIHYEINSNKSRFIKRWSLGNVLKWSARIASVILLLFATYFMGFYSQRMSHTESYVEIIAPTWTRAQFKLPDGTTGWLNSNSRIKYNGDFFADRQVTLSGEAFFNVSENQKRPFIVKTDDVFVTVLGTRFNIACYENEKTIEVVLEKGKLLFNNMEMNISYVMNPNDLVRYDKTVKNIATEKVEPFRYISWIDGQLVFRNDPMDVIARRLERWYDIDVEIRGNIDQDIRLRATFVDDSLEDVLYLLKRSLNINYEINERYMNSDDTYMRKKVIITME